MSNILFEIRKRKPGILYLLLAITGFYTQFVMKHFNSIFESSQWFEIIIQKESFFASGILSFYLMNIVWLLLAFSIYNVFRNNNRKISGLLLLTVVSGAMIVFIIILLQSSPLYLVSLLSRIPETNKQIWIDRTHFIFLVGMKANVAAFIFYSIWLFPLAFLILKEKSIAIIERIILFISLCIAGIGYMADFLLFHLLNILIKPLDL